jgi:hypothetical protein
MRFVKGRTSNFKEGRLFICLLIGIALLPNLHAPYLGLFQIKAETLGDEYSVKGAYLLNFAKFTNWKHSPPRTSESAFTICTWRADPLKEVVAALESKTVLNLAVKTKVTSSLERVAECDILFVASTESADILKLTSVVTSSGTLLVSEGEGGMISFIPSKNGQIRFSCNLHFAEKAGIKFSSQLISLAVRVEEG